MNFRCNCAIRRSEMSQTKTQCNSSKSVDFRLLNCKQRCKAFTAKFWNSATLTAIFRWRLRTEMFGAVILSEAKNLWSFPRGDRKQYSEMFRFAQHDIRHAGGLCSDWKLRVINRAPL